MQSHAYKLAGLWKVWLASHTTAIAVVSIGNFEKRDHMRIITSVLCLDCPS